MITISVLAVFSALKVTSTVLSQPCLQYQHLLFQYNFFFRKYLLQDHTKKKMSGKLPGQRSNENTYKEWESSYRYPAQASICYTLTPPAVSGIQMLHPVYSLHPKIDVQAEHVSCSLNASVSTSLLTVKSLQRAMVTTGSAVDTLGNWAQWSSCVPSSSGCSMIQSDMRQIPPSVFIKFSLKYRNVFCFFLSHSFLVDCKCCL